MAELAMKYKQYEKYKESGVEWLDVIPSHWVMSKIKYISPFQVGWTPPTGNDSNFIGENIWANISDLRGKVITDTVKRISDKAAKEASMDITPKGSLLYSFKLSVGSVSFAGCDMYTNEAIASFTSDSLLPLEYLYYVLPKFLIENASTNIYGARILNQELIRNAIILKPTYEEAETIANFLDHETAQIDTLIEKQQTLIQLLKEKRQAVISHAVTKGLNPDAPMKDSGVDWLGEVPEHWDITRIKYVAELTPSKARILPSLEKRCSFVPMEKLKLDTLILDETRKIKDVYQGYTYFEDGDVLIAKVTPCFENQNMAIAANLVNGIGFGSSEIYVLRTEAEGLNQFLLYRLQESVFMQLGAGAMTGAGGLRRVPSDFINDFQFALPPINEQQEIVAYIEKMKNTFNDLVYKAEQAIQLMQERRTALISAAVTGKIDVRSWVAPLTNN